MCAIAGLLDMNWNATILDNMLATMKRRGPDSCGIFTERGCCLLHSRLSIIDPVGGQQPMLLRWKKEVFVLVYNGELYNTQELRNELIKLGHTFQGHSDTEVVLHAYAQWSSACLERFNGIYAFAIWESKSQRLFLARDRAGVKPLFFMMREKSMLFASEIKTILSYPGVHAKMDEEGIAELLLLGPGRTPGCGVLQGIEELEPGCCGYYQDGRFLWQRYWKLRDREHTEDFEETAEHVRYLVTDSIRRQMISDVPVGTFLSGGLDSSIISSVCSAVYADMGRTLDTFSLDYEKNDQYFVPGKFQPNTDKDFILKMAKHIGSNHHHTILQTQQLVDALSPATYARDLPGMADVDFSLLVFCGEIRKHVKVALSGECADEIFGGYPWYRDPEIRAVEGFPWSQNIKERAGFLHTRLRNKIDGFSYVMDRYNETICQCDILPHNTATERRMKQMVNLNIRWFMQTLLDRKDRMSMYNSLEVRVPFCDHRIMEYMYAVPWDFKDHNGQEKGLLRYAMSDWLPDEVRNRKKSPYPKTFDPNYLKLVSELLKNVIADKDAPIHQIVNTDSLRNLLTAEYTWPWYGQLMRVPQTIAYMLQINDWLTKYHVEIVV